MTIGVKSCKRHGFEASHRDRNARFISRFWTSVALSTYSGVVTKSISDSEAGHRWETGSPIRGFHAAVEQSVHQSIPECRLSPQHRAGSGDGSVLPRGMDYVLLILAASSHYLYWCTTMNPRALESNREGPRTSHTVAQPPFSPLDDPARQPAEYRTSSEAKSQDPTSPGAKHIEEGDWQHSHCILVNPAALDLHLNGQWGPIGRCPGSHPCIPLNPMHPLFRSIRLPACTRHSKETRVHGTWFYTGLCDPGARKNTKPHLLQDALVRTGMFVSIHEKAITLSSAMIRNHDE
ncbi:hypothetical protein BV22DRAFT_1042540 [Leucogyrophana mollusca]|uniref:Uncharacterized protein n=1 Tax=Leucogyrophana mollusca TaxID=85980 RepID=A0ACB8C023_9AGAM|nr:hypothetical protein BV22DRAFT_1042540 [Leucogyrophana mollusca]